MTISILYIDCFLVRFQKMAKLIDGNKISKEVLNEVSEELRQIQQKHPDFKPTLAIVQVKKF